MIAVLGGLGASLCWAISSLCASAASRRIGASSTLAWVMGLGLILVLPPTILFADTNQLTTHTVLLLVIAGLGNVAGLELEYVAFRHGKVGVVAPIASTEGAIAALIAVVAGLHVASGTLLLLLLVVCGVALSAAQADPPPPPEEVDAGGATHVRSAFLAIPVAVLFGVSLYATGHVGSRVSVWWVLLSARLLGTLLLMMPLAARRSLALPGKAWPLVAAAGAAEVVGILSYTLGARHQLAVAAVLASQFAALAAVGAYLVLGERLTRIQIAGLVLVAIGVAALAISTS